MDGRTVNGTGSTPSASSGIDPNPAQTYTLRRFVNQEKVRARSGFRGLAQYV